MRKAGIASLILLAAGLVIVGVWPKTYSSQGGLDNSFNPEYVGLIFLLPNMAVGFIISILIAVSLWKPLLAGIIAILLSIPGILLWGYALISGFVVVGRYPAELSNNLVFSLFFVLPYFASAIALFIDGGLSIEEFLDKPKSQLPQTGS